MKSCMYSMLCAQIFFWQLGGVDFREPAHAGQCNFDPTKFLKFGVKCKLPVFNTYCDADMENSKLLFNEHSFLELIPIAIGL